MRRRKTNKKHQKKKASGSPQKMGIHSFFLCGKVEVLRSCQSHHIQADGGKVVKLVLFLLMVLCCSFLLCSVFCLVLGDVVVYFVEFPFVRKLVWPEKPEGKTKHVPRSNKCVCPVSNNGRSPNWKVAPHPLSFHSGRVESQLLYELWYIVFFFSDMSVAAKQKLLCPKLALSCPSRLRNQGGLPPPPPRNQIYRGCRRPRQRKRPFHQKEACSLFFVPPAPKGRRKIFDHTEGTSKWTLTCYHKSKKFGKLVVVMP